VGSWDGWRDRGRGGSWSNCDGFGGKWKETRNIDMSEIRKENRDRKMVVTKEIRQKMKVRGEQLDRHCKNSSCGKDSGYEDFGQMGETCLDEGSALEDLEVTFGRLVKLEELLARGSKNRVKLEKTTNYLTKVVEDLQLEAEEEENSVQPTLGKANFGSTDVRLKKKRVQDEDNSGSNEISTPVTNCRGSWGQPLLPVGLGLESFKTSSVEDLYNLSQQAEGGAAEVSEGSLKLDQDILLPPERIASGPPLQEEQDVVESKSESVEELSCKEVDEAVEEEGEKVESTQKEELKGPIVILNSDSGLTGDT